MCKIEYAWPSRALSHDDIKLSAAAFRPGRLFRLSRHRDPAPVGVCHTVPVESSLLHCSGIDELSKEGTFCFRPALVNNSGSIRTIRFFRAGVNYFRDVIRRPLHSNTSITAASPIVTMRIRWVSPIWNPPKFKGGDCRHFYVPTCGRARIRATGGATGAFSAPSRDRKTRKTLRMLIPSACAASPLVLPASTKAKTCAALARAVGMPPRYLPSALALAIPSSCRASMMLLSNSAIDPMI
jgi:hypothetical protein